MARSIVLNVVLPLLIFVPMSYVALDLLAGRLKKAGLLNLDENCPKPFINKPPFQLHYLGGYAPAVENILCILVGFFHTLFAKESAAAHRTPFVYDFLASIVAPISIPVLEATRANRPYLLALPVIYGLSYQVIGGGVVFPIYYMVFLATTRNKALGSQIDKASARAVMFGLVLGYVVPSIAMVYTGEHRVIAFWQAVPLWISVFQHFYLLFGPGRSSSGSGYGTVQAIYAFIFIGTATVHIRSMSTYDWDPRVIADAYLPSLAMPSARKGHTGLDSAIHFLQWDFALVFGSSMLASLWFATNTMQVVLLTVWSALGTFAFGPGAAVSAIYMWREAKLKQMRQKQVPAIKIAKAQ